MKNSYRFWIIILAFLCAGDATDAYAQATKGNVTLLPRQYKRVHQKALTQIENGEVDKAIKGLITHEVKYPGDGETSYMLAAAYVKAKKLKQAESQVNQALKRGLPIGRLLAGPDSLFKPLHKSKVWKKLLKDKSLIAQNFIIHGPMLGRISPDSVSFWVRTAKATRVSITIVPAKAGQTPQTYIAKGATQSNDDFTTVLTVKGLRANTKYHYFIGDKRTNKPTGEFKTAPAVGQSAKFTFAFGGGAGYVPPNERMWDTINNTKPDLLLLLGDNTYSDMPKSTAMQEYCYYRRQSRPEFSKLIRKTPVYTIWDDHDFATNDSWGGPEIRIPAWKPKVYKTYTQNWVNPYFGGGPKQPGCWYHFSYADVDFFMLDGRYYREGPKTSKSPSMLGPVQLKWLIKQLKASKAKIKVIASPVPWEFRTKGGSFDTWNGYKDEREKIFSFIEKQKIDGVFLISADRHRSDAWEIKRNAGNSFYEFNSSRLTNQHVHNTMKEAIFSYNKKQSFGLVTIDTNAKDPTVQYQVINIDGEKVHTLKLKKSQFPVSSKP